ncbi:hypothetical protein TUM19329_12920 [Legionella antarctica]|uniref:Uncharacterized protein n=1 Tax=Legionella antarctica TaxID=2708020 RepID=A0A6F8T389_9GAMM|nr:hypothetical protein TUM19329_12920 [Legionella antarctica]
MFEYENNEKPEAQGRGEQVEVKNPIKQGGKEGKRDSIQYKLIAYNQNFFAV